MKFIKNVRLPTLIFAGIALTASVEANTITPTAQIFTSGVSITYSADLTSGEMHAGDGFTIFDIGGFVGFGAVPASWATSFALTGSPFGVPLGADDVSLTNVTFTYTGAAVEVGVGPLLPLGLFVVNTTGTALVTDDWTSRDHLLGTVGVIDGAIGPGDRGNILVPGGANTPGVPDGGATVLLLGAALTGLVWAKRRMM